MSFQEILNSMPKQTHYTVENGQINSRYSSLSEIIPDIQGCTTLLRNLSSLIPHVVYGSIVVTENNGILFNFDLSFIDGKRLTLAIEQQTGHRAKVSLGNNCTYTTTQIAEYLSDYKKSIRKLKPVDKVSMNNFEKKSTKIVNLFESLYDDDYVVNSYDNDENKVYFRNDVAVKGYQEPITVRYGEAFYVELVSNTKLNIVSILYDDAVANNSYLYNNTKKRIWTCPGDITEDKLLDFIHAKCPRKFGCRRYPAKDAWSKLCSMPEFKLNGDTLFIGNVGTKRIEARLMQDENGYDEIRVKISEGEKYKVDVIKAYSSNSNDIITNIKLYMLHLERMPHFLKVL